MMERLSQYPDSLKHPPRANRSLASAVSILKAFLPFPPSISTSPTPPMAGKKNPGGRKKIEIKRISTEEARQVCFSKRRMGLFKKACELCILCGAEVAVVVYSPAGRPYSLGGPDVGMVADRFLSPGQPSTSDPALCAPAAAAAGWRHREDPSELRRALTTEKRNRAALEQALEAARCGASDVNRMQLEELEAMERALQGLRAEVAMWTSEIVLEMEMEMEATSWGGVAPSNPAAVVGCHQEKAGTGAMDSAFRFF